MIVIAFSNLDELANVVDAVSSATVLSESRIEVLYTGEESQSEFLGLAGLPDAGVTYLGPDTPSRRPVAFWTAAVAMAEAGSDLLVASVYNGLPFTRGKESTGSVPGFIDETMKVRESMRSRGVVGDVDLRRWAGEWTKVAQSYGSNPGLRAFSRYLRALEACVSDIYWSPNECTWADCWEVRGRWCNLGLGLQRSLQEFDRSYAAAPWLPTPSDVVPAITGLDALLADPLVSADAATRERLHAWTAYFLARAELGCRQSHHANALVLAWRSYEQFVLSEALRVGLVRLDRDTGTFCWRSPSHRYTHPTTNALLRSLEERGDDMRPGEPQLSARLVQLAEIRNRSMWGHGVSGADAAAAREAVDVVRGALRAVGKEGPAIEARADEVSAYFRLAPLGHGILRSAGVARSGSGHAPATAPPPSKQR